MTAETAPIVRLLVANRGEIAVRIMATAADMGIETVSVAPEDDANALHAHRSDHHVTLPGIGAAAYLNVEMLVTAAKDAGCDAIHPGYGFVSEQPRIATACEDAGLVFVGPSAEVLRTLGDKQAALELARDLGVRVAVSSIVETTDSLRTALDVAAGRVMLKAVNGGGGLGMRIVGSDDDLADVIERCRSEALRAFGDDQLYAEQLIESARHVEVQIIGDGTGAVVVLGDRECSLQRRRQKVMEFAPAFGIGEAVRDEMRNSAVLMAAAVGYRGLATFEFLVDARDVAYFMEANARLQVEHTVTEAVTGLDLVALQLKVASGVSLSDIGLVPGRSPAISGFAVQARVNAERVDPSGDATPTGGTITEHAVPTGPSIRVDTYGCVGYTTNPRYDSLMSKVISHGETREVALRRLSRALRDFSIVGLETNIDFLAALAESPEVVSGDLDTLALERIAPSLPISPSFVATPVAEASLDGAIVVVAPLQGTIVSVSVAPGDPVAVGAQVAVMEAMKMEHVLLAVESGLVEAVAVTVGDTVFEGDLLVRLTPSDVASEESKVTTERDPDEIRPDLAEAIDRHEIGLDHRRPDAVAKRRKVQRRTARENVDDLLDDDSLIEYGALTIAPQRRRRSVQELIEKTPGDGMVSGLGRVNGHLHGDASRCAVVSYDYTVLAGTQGGQNHRKKDRLFELAEQLRLPVVLFAEGGGGRPGDTDGMVVAGLDCLAFALFGGLSGLVPLVGINTGYCFAGNAALLGMCDVVIATPDSNVGMGGPAMIEGGGLGVYHPTDIGPADEQFALGVIDILVDNDVEAVRVAKKYLSYFQGDLTDWTAPDQRRLRHVVPENRLRVYEIRDVIDLVADDDSVLELRSGWGPGMVTALARIEGRAVGIIANNPMHLAGAIDSDAADKAARFMQLCDAFDIPLVFLCDTPGIMVGPEAERSGTVRHASRMFVTGAGIDVPFCTIVIRKGYGLGAQAMAGGSFKAPLFTVSWPTGEFGGMGLEGAVRLGYRNELEAITDPDERAASYQKRVDRMYEIGKALNFASAFELDDVIDPADTRRWIAGVFDLTPPPGPRTGKKRPNIDAW